MATLQPGEKARMFALGGVMRGGASRGGYVSGKAFIAIDGVHVGFGGAAPQVLIKSLTIVDELDEAPNTCAFRTNGIVPATGSEVIVTRGSKNSLTRAFAGFALTVRQLYVGDKPANVQAEVSCVDYTWLLGFVKVTKRYINLPADAIAADLIATCGAANGFTSAVQPALPFLNEITITNEELDAVFTRIARRIGGYWYVDYQKRVHLFLAEDGQAPEPLVETHRSLADFAMVKNRTQALTRCYVEGQGARLLSSVLAGDTLIPLDTIAGFTAAADVFLKVSPQGSDGGAQHLNFSGVQAGGVGSLVGPGAGPPGAPGAVVALGAGLSAGWYQYAYTFQTASGESLPSPIGWVQVGTLLAPPAAAPGAVPEVFAGGVTAGDHWYTTTFATPSGETTIGPYTGTISTRDFPLAYPGAAPVQALGPSPGGSIPANRDYVYKQTYVGTTGETTLGEYAWHIITGPTPNVQYQVTPSGTPASVQKVRIYRATGLNAATAGTYHLVGEVTPGGSLLDGLSDAALAAQPVAPATNTAIQHPGKVTLSGIALGPAGTVARKVYRTRVSDNNTFLVATIADNTTATYVDTTPDASLGAAPPGVNTAGDEYRRVQLSNISTGPTTPPAVTSRKLYRSIAGGAQLKLLATLADNTTTSYLDAIADGSLGANAPVSDSSGITQPSGQVPAGATSVIVANAAAFPATGWAVIGNGEQVIRYTGKTTSALTGVPASDIGSISAAVVYNSTITAAPMLTGISGIVTPLRKGDEIYLVVRVDDVARQAALADMVNIGPGLREEWVQDRRLSITEARARGAATLAQRPLEQVAISYRCRDTRSAAGKTITVNLPAPTNVSGTFKAQRVTINNWRPHENQQPTFTVEASDQRFSFEDWLRRLEVRT